MLLAFAKKLRAAASLNTPGLVVGNLTRDEQYDQLMYGEIAGIGTVTIDRTGDMTGLSPVERCKSKSGEIDWIPTNLITNFRSEPFLFSKSPASSAVEGAATPHRARRRGRPTRHTTPATT